MEYQERHDFTCSVYFGVSLDVTDKNGNTVFEINNDGFTNRIFLNDDQIKVLIELLERKLVR